MTDEPGNAAPDEELVRRAKEGDEGSFALLLRRHERRVYNLCYRMVGREEDARDAAQEAFLSAYRRLHSFRGDSAFTTWLHRIAVNACYDMLRKRRVEPLPLEAVPEPPAGGDPAEGAAVAVDVQRALREVPSEFRAALVLHDVLGFAYDEVAEILGVPVGTVKSRLHRGRVALARVIGGEPAGTPLPSKPENSI